MGRNRCCHQLQMSSYIPNCRPTTTRQRNLAIRSTGCFDKREAGQTAGIVGRYQVGIEQCRDTGEKIFNSIVADAIVEKVPYIYAVCCEKDELHGQKTLHTSK